MSHFWGVGILRAEIGQFVEIKTWKRTNDDILVFKSPLKTSNDQQQNTCSSHLNYFQPLAIFCWQIFGFKEKSTFHPLVLKNRPVGCWICQAETLLRRPLLRVRVRVLVPLAKNLRVLWVEIWRKRRVRNQLFDQLFVFFFFFFFGGSLNKCSKKRNHFLLKKERLRGWLDWLVQIHGVWFQVDRS